MLKAGEPYRDPGPDHLARRSKPKQAQGLPAKLADLGYAVSIPPTATDA